jgi:flavin-binding protein dodecin
MSVARVTEVIASSKKSFDDAIETGVEACSQNAEECDGRVGAGSKSNCFRR